MAAKPNMAGKWSLYTVQPTRPRTRTLTMFLPSSKRVFTWKRFLKYFVGLSLSNLGTSGAVATNGPTWKKSPRIAIKAAIKRIEPIISTVGISVTVNI